MNIWIFNHYVAAPGDFGITRHLDLAKELVERKHKVTIFASSFNHWERKEKRTFENGEKFKIEYINGIRVVWLKTYPYHKNSYQRILNILSYWTNLKSFNYKILDEKPDYVVGSMMHHLAAWIGYRVAKKFKAKFVFEERDLWPESLIHLAGLSEKNLLVKVLGKFETFMYKKADKIIVLFDKAPLYVKSKGINPSKIVYLPNGADLSRAKKVQKVEFLEQHKEHFKNKVVIGYTGSLSRANNMDRIIKLAEKLKDDEMFYFVFIGEGSYKKELEEYISNHSMNNCVFFPPVSKDLLPSVLNYFDFGIISLKDSSLYKWGFSLNKLYDYMSAGLPIVIDTSIEPNVVSENSLGISENDLDTSIEKLKNLDSIQYEILKGNSKKYVLENHDWSILAEKFEAEVMSIKSI